MTRRFLFALLLIAFLPSQLLAATLYIAEFSGGLPDGTPVARQPALVEQTVAIGGSATSSSAFSGDTKLIRVHTDAICSIKIGAAPTATATAARMSADSTEYFYVLPGHKISVITNN